MASKAVRGFPLRIPPDIYFAVAVELHAVSASSRCAGRGGMGLRREGPPHGFDERPSAGEGSVVPRRNSLRVGLRGASMSGTVCA